MSSEATPLVGIIMGSKSDMPAMEGAVMRLGEGFDGYIDVLVREKSVLEDMISHLRQINGVQTVQRTDIV